LVVEIFTSLLEDGLADLLFLEQSALLVRDALGRAYFFLLRYLRALDVEATDHSFLVVVLVVEGGGVLVFHHHLVLINWLCWDSSDNVRVHWVLIFRRLFFSHKDFVDMLELLLLHLKFFQNSP
jgi:hypothetical protein